MTSKAQKFTPNIALKVAIVSTGCKQAEIAERARIHQVRLSKIVTGVDRATAQEQKDLARVLRRKPSELFLEIVSGDIEAERAAG